MKTKETEALSYSHRVAVTAFIIDNGRFLLLKRNNAPRVWGLPGGRLNRDEDPNTGIHREIFEETGLTVEIISPAGIWYGDFGQGIYISIDYLARKISGDVVLSDEHADYRWASLDDLKKGNPPLSESASGFSLPYFINAWALYVKMTAR